MYSGVGTSTSCMSVCVEQARQASRTETKQCLESVPSEHPPTLRRPEFHSRDLSGRGTARAEDAEWTPTQSHTSPSILVFEEYLLTFGVFPWCKSTLVATGVLPPRISGRDCGCNPQQWSKFVPESCRWTVSAKTPVPARFCCQIKLKGLI